MLVIKANLEEVNLYEQMRNVPLKHVCIVTTIRSFAADVTIQQIFRNDEETPIEALYCFPIEERAAIYSFKAYIGDREIIAELREKTEGQQEYREALQKGHGAFLLEQNENSQDTFIVNVGALPPSTECIIAISYVSELESIDQSTIEFVVPTTIAPRYEPQNGNISSPANTNAPYVQSTPYTIEFDCRVENFEQQIARIDSTSHLIEVDSNQDDVFMVKFRESITHLDRDIRLIIELEEKYESRILAVESGAVMVAFVPKNKDEYQQIISKNEFIFVVDCSGSMESECKIELVRQAMLIFVKSLPVDCYFNIIRFGTNYESLFARSTGIYSEENVHKAQEYIQRMKADLGGTELVSIFIFDLVIMFYFYIFFSYNLVTTIAMVGTRGTCSRSSTANFSFNRRRSFKCFRSN